MFDIDLQEFVAIDGSHNAQFEVVKDLDIKHMVWYSEQLRGAYGENHISTCHTCSAVRAMYEEAYAEQVSRGLEVLNPLSPELTQAAMQARIDQLDRLLSERTIERDNKAYLHEKAQETVDRLRYEAAAPIQANDKRLWDIFGKAARIANEEGYCSEYDRISEAAGIPSRDELRGAGYLTSTYEVRTLVTFTLSVIVDADSEDDAISKVDYMDASELMEHLSLGDVDADDIDNHDARQAERIEE